MSKILFSILIVYIFSEDCDTSKKIHLTVPHTEKDSNFYFYSEFTSHTHRILKKNIYSPNDIPHGVNLKIRVDKWLIPSTKTFDSRYHANYQNKIDLESFSIDSLKNSIYFIRKSDLFTSNVNIKAHSRLRIVRQDTTETMKISSVAISTVLTTVTTDAPKFIYAIVGIIPTNTSVDFKVVPATPLTVNCVINYTRILTMDTRHFSRSGDLCYNVHVLGLQPNERYELTYSNEFSTKAITVTFSTACTDYMFTNFTTNTFNISVQVDPESRFRSSCVFSLKNLDLQTSTDIAGSGSECNSYETSYVNPGSNYDLTYFNNKGCNNLSYTFVSKILSYLMVVSDQTLNNATVTITASDFYPYQECKFTLSTNGRTIAHQCKPSPCPEDCSNLFLVHLCPNTNYSLNGYPLFASNFSTTFTTAYLNFDLQIHIASLTSVSINLEGIPNPQNCQMMLSLDQLNWFPATCSSGACPEDCRLATIIDLNINTMYYILITESHLCDQIISNFTTECLTYRIESQHQNMTEFTFTVTPHARSDEFCNVTLYNVNTGFEYNEIFSSLDCTRITLRNLIPTHAYRLTYDSRQSCGPLILIFQMDPFSYSYELSNKTCNSVRVQINREGHTSHEACTTEISSNMELKHDITCLAGPCPTDCSPFTIINLRKNTNYTLHGHPTLGSPFNDFFLTLNNGFTMTTTQIVPTEISINIDPEVLPAQCSLSYRLCSSPLTSFANSIRECQEYLLSGLKLAACYNLSFTSSMSCEITTTEIMTTEVTFQIRSSFVGPNIASINMLPSQLILGNMCFYDLTPTISLRTICNSNCLTNCNLIMLNDLRPDVDYRISIFSNYTLHPTIHIFTTVHNTYLVQTIRRNFTSIQVLITSQINETSACELYISLDKTRNFQPAECDPSPCSQSCQNQELTIVDLAPSTTYILEIRATDISSFQRFPISTKTLNYTLIITNITKDGFYLIVENDFLLPGRCTFTLYSYSDKVEFNPLCNVPLCPLDCSPRTIVGLPSGSRFTVNFYPVGQETIQAHVITLIEPPQNIIFRLMKDLRVGFSWKEAPEVFVVYSQMVFVYKNNDNVNDPEVFRVEYDVINPIQEEDFKFIENLTISSETTFITLDLEFGQLYIVYFCRLVPISGMTCSKAYIKLRLNDRITGPFDATSLNMIYFVKFPVLKRSQGDIRNCYWIVSTFVSLSELEETKFEERMINFNITHNILSHTSPVQQIYIAASLTGDQCKNSTVFFPIGDGSKYQGFSNPDLKFDLYYVVVFRACQDVNLCSNSYLYQHLKTPPDWITLIILIGATATSILFLLWPVYSQVWIGNINSKSVNSKDMNDKKKEKLLQPVITTESKYAKNIVEVTGYRAKLKVSSFRPSSYGMNTKERLENGILIKDLQSYVIDLEQNGKMQCSLSMAKFDSIPYEPYANCKVGANSTKNRYGNILVNNEHRVALTQIPKSPDSDYINATYFDDHNVLGSYIACQGPLPDTVNDFWRMICEQNVHSIVMLTGYEEKGKIKCHRYLPTSDKPIVTPNDVKVSFSTESKPAKDILESSVTLSYSHKGKIQTREVKQFHYTGWPDNGVPSNTFGLQQLRKILRDWQKKKDGPIVIHCSAGVGRTGTFLIYDYNMKRIESGEPMLDVYDCIVAMRTRRPFMVQTADQYLLIHHLLLAEQA